MERKYFMDYNTRIFSSLNLACERRRMSGCHLVPPKNNVCEPEPENDFCDVEILSQSQFSSNNPRTTVRGIRCEEHSSFILSWNLIGQGETKVITSQKSLPGSGSQTLFFGGNKRQPEIRLRSQASLSWVNNEKVLIGTLITGRLLGVAV